MRPEPETIRRVLSAQMAKAGPPMDGKDLHIGDFAVRHPSAQPRRSAAVPLTIAGIAMAFAREGAAESRCRSSAKAASSLGEWHEAINLCAARRLPAVFCVENNQTALSTPVRDQSAVRVFADKAAGYGIRASPSTAPIPTRLPRRSRWAVERARAGRGSDADRTDLHAHVRPRASRRHAVSRQGSAAVLGLPAAAPGRATSAASATRTGRRAIRFQVCGASRGGWPASMRRLSTT